ncbi:MAG: sulfite oxidase-like oxidoreductase [Acidimicrobiales bacterium]
MKFFDRSRKELERQGIDPARLPPGQYATARFPVLHAGSVPTYRDLSAWNLRVFGMVERELTLSWQDLLDLPAVELTVDIHCVTKWSKFDTVWKGVAFQTICELAGVHADARHLLEHAEFGYTTNVPLADVTERPALLAYEFDGAPLAPDHGFPLRFFVPHLYFWKSAKWLRGLEFLSLDQPGFWERNGYHNYGDPFREQRYTER